MKIFKFIFLILTILSGLSLDAAENLLVKKEANVIEVDAERVWTFNYFELSKLPATDKNDLVKSVVQEAQKNNVLNKIKETNSENVFKSVVDSEGKWKKVAQKIYHFCQDSHNSEDCERIAKLRSEILHKNGSHR